MARSRSDSTIPCNQCSSEFFGKRNVGGIVGRKIVTQLPDSWQEHEMRIPSNTKIQRVADYWTAVLNGLLAPFLPPHPWSSLRTRN
jgi:hypothetical protein